MTELRVRPMSPRDLPAASSLAAELLRLHHAWDPRRFRDVRDPATGYARLFGEPDTFALVAERSVAYARVEPRDWYLDRAGHLHDLRRAGSARPGGRRSRPRPRPPRRARRLQTATQNDAGQRLFARLGFRSTMVEMTCEVAPPER